MQTKFRTQAACRIARISPQRFNEAVAAGNYPCAPEVARGSTRVFTESDLIALFFYGQLLEQGFPPRLAGQYACRVSAVLDRVPDENEVVVIRSEIGKIEGLAGSLLEETPKASSAGLVLQRFIFDVENARKIIRKEIAEELSVIGEDDE